MPSSFFEKLKSSSKIDNMLWYRYNSLNFTLTTEFSRDLNLFFILSALSFAQICLKTWESNQNFTFQLFNSKNVTTAEAVFIALCFDMFAIIQLGVYITNWSE